MDKLYWGTLPFPSDKVDEEPSYHTDYLELQHLGINTLMIKDEVITLHSRASFNVVRKSVVFECTDSK